MDWLYMAWHCHKIFFMHLSLILSSSRFICYIIYCPLLLVLVSLLILLLEQNPVAENMSSARIPRNKRISLTFNLSGITSKTPLEPIYLQEYFDNGKLWNNTGRNASLNPSLFQIDTWKGNSGSIWMNWKIQILFLEDGQVVIPPC